MWVKATINPTAASNIDVDVKVEKNSTTNNINTSLEELTVNDNDKTLEAKEEMTQEEISNESPVLEFPINWTDPIVWHDPSFEKGIIVKQVSADTGDGEAVSQVDNEQTSHKIDSVYFPLIKINQLLINNNDIVYFKLQSKNILPELYLEIVDSNDTISNTNASGMNNEIVIVITSPVDGVYKKIKLPFYINSVRSDLVNGKHILSYHCKLKITKLIEKYPTAMNFPNKKQWPGCKKCKQPEEQQPNSWEMLHFIANECKLGFASTKQCKEISDRTWRRLNYYKNLEDCLIQEKKYAGTDDESAIFDWWIDFYGYIVMVNMPWVMNEDIDHKHLAMYGVTGVQPTSSNNSAPEPQVKLLNRTLSNSKDTASFAFNHNMMIRTYEVITDNSLYEMGTCSSNNVFKPKGAGGNNGITKTDIQVQEISVAGLEVEKYTTQQTYMRGVDMSGFNKSLKTTLFDTYFKKQRSKLLRIELENFNLGLQRGTLIHVAIMETNSQNKATILNNTDNVASTRPEGDPDPLQHDSASQTSGDVSDDAPSKEDILQNESIEIVNYGLSGLYYIDSITFEYSSNKEQRIYQTLYLIKKEPWGNYSSPNALYKINHTQYDSRKNSI